MKVWNCLIYGDVVVVELFFKNEWKGRIVVLCENDCDDKVLGEFLSEFMFIGWVVGIF